jgi:hypothetical protein
MIFNHEGTTHSHLFKEGKNDDMFYIRNKYDFLNLIFNYIALI